jgi:hypothetical protein
MSSGLRELSMHLRTVSLGKVLMKMSTMLRLVDTWMYLDVSQVQVMLESFDLQVDMIGS